MKSAIPALVAGVVILVVAGSIAANVLIQAPGSATQSSLTSSSSRSLTTYVSIVSVGSSTAISTSQTTYTQTTYSTASSSLISSTLSPSTSTTTTTSSRSSTTTSSRSTTTTSSSTSTTSSHAGAVMILVPLGVGGNESLNFQPAQIRVVLGVNSTIVWNDTDYDQHNIESSTIPTGATAWNSGTLNQGQTYTVTLTVVGTYKYFCEIHPWMVGTIQVVS